MPLNQPLRQPRPVWGDSTAHAGDAGRASRHEACVSAACWRHALVGALPVMSVSLPERIQLPQHAHHCPPAPGRPSSSRSCCTRPAWRPGPSPASLWTPRITAPAGRRGVSHCLIRRQRQGSRRAARARRLLRPPHPSGTGRLCRSSYYVAAGAGRSRLACASRMQKSIMEHCCAEPWLPVGCAAAWCRWRRAGTTRPRARGARCRRP